jgi:hypothetical protein
MDALMQISFLLRYQSVAAITNFLSALRSHGISVLDFCFLESLFVECDREVEEYLICTTSLSNYGEEFDT